MNGPLVTCGFRLSGDLMILGRHRAEMVRGQRGMRPSTQYERNGANARVRWKVIERSSAETSAEVIRSASKCEHRTTGCPELPGEVHVARIVGLPIRPHQMGSQMEGPGGGIGADAPILHGGHFARRPGVYHPLRIPIEERQVERIVDHWAKRSPRAIGDERIWVL